jgi:hypothetical protein
MEAKTKKRIEAVLDEALALAQDGADEYEAARKALTAQTSDVLIELAVAAIVDVVRRRQRADVLTIERAATSNTPRRPRRTSEDWTPRGDEEEMYHEMGYSLSEAIRAKHVDELGRAIGENVAKFTAELRIEWTAELLGSDFALADGTRVTWGEATVEQHEERAAMFQRNAVANAEGAARHLHALEALKFAGRETLNDLVGVAA